MSAAGTVLASDKASKPLRAYAVTETCEGTGGIVFARHNVVARREGACQFGDGDFHGVECRRAPWADQFAADGIIPVSAMIYAGWHFECTGCGRRIDHDLPLAWENEVGADEPLNGANLRYARWKPDHVIGSQHGTVFCRQSCKNAHDKEQAARKRFGDRAIARFERVILRRLPGSVIEHKEYLRPHVYVTRNRLGQLIVEQAIVSFSFPGQAIGAAALRMDTETQWERGKAVSRKRKIKWTCCNGDREAFEAFAAATKRAVPA
ncbi:MAG TPA: hypothetical protein VKQ09_05815 [Sphingomonas sp.]|nr:hypothetical protein [Sphingomonas sp.]